MLAEKIIGDLDYDRRWDRACARMKQE